MFINIKHPTKQISPIKFIKKNYLKKFEFNLSKLVNLIFSKFICKCDFFSNK